MRLMQFQIDDSWKSQFEASGAFDSIDTQIAGLGEIDAIQQLLLLKSVQMTHLTPDNKKYRYLYHTHIH